MRLKLSRNATCEAYQAYYTIDRDLNLDNNKDNLNIDYIYRFNDLISLGVKGHLSGVQYENLDRGFLENAYDDYVSQNRENPLSKDAYFEKMVELAENNTADIATDGWKQFYRMVLNDYNLYQVYKARREIVTKCNEIIDLSEAYAEASETYEFKKSEVSDTELAKYKEGVSKGIKIKTQIQNELNDLDAQIQNTTTQIVQQYEPKLTPLKTSINEKEKEAKDAAEKKKEALDKDDLFYQFDQITDELNTLMGKLSALNDKERETILEQLQNADDKRAYYTWTPKNSNYSEFTKQQREKEAFDYIEDRYGYVFANKYYIPLKRFRDCCAQLEDPKLRDDLKRVKLEDLATKIPEILADASKTHINGDPKLQEIYDNVVTYSAKENQAKKDINTLSAQKDAVEKEKANLLKTKLQPIETKRSDLAFLRDRYDALKAAAKEQKKIRNQIKDANLDSEHFTINAEDKFSNLMKDALKKIESRKTPLHINSGVYSTLLKNLQTVANWKTLELEDKSPEAYKHAVNALKESAEKYKEAKLEQTRLHPSQMRQQRLVVTDLILDSIELYDEFKDINELHLGQRGTINTLKAIQDEAQKQANKSTEKEVQANKELSPKEPTITNPELVQPALH